MNFNRIKKAIQACQGKALVLMLAVLLFAPDIFAQNYTITLKQRRMGDQIGVEFWLKGASSSVPKIGNMTIGVTYNTAHLSPADPASYALHTTDSVAYNVEQVAPLPYTSFTSSFHSANGYSALSANPVTDGVNYVYIMHVSIPTVPSTQGIAASTDGIGSFVGRLVFDIVGHSTLTLSDMTNISFNSLQSIGNFVLYDVNGNDVKSNATVVNSSNMAIRGITILNPNGPSEAVNRNKTYTSMATAGYPIYFERSGLFSPVATSRYGTSNKLAYGFDYVVGYNSSLSESAQNWTEFMRVAEHRDAQNTLGTTANYQNGEITTSNGAGTGFLITQGDGSQLPVGSGDGYGGVLRVMWDDDPFFPYRSEQARLRIRQLDTTGTGSDISLRSNVTDGAYDISDANFILSRIFFLQLDGATEFMKTQNKFDNPTQFSVEAWVNLTSINSGTFSTIEPAILASSSGPNTTEGTWMLYLKDGKYPAFRVKDHLGGGTGRGENGTAYIANVISPEAISSASAAVPIDTNTAQPGNWHHIAGVVSNNIVSVYVDGELMGRSLNDNAIDIRPEQGSQPIWIGVNPNGTVDANDYLNAGIKEVKIWRKAMTQGEIRQYMSGVTDPSASPFANGDNRNSLEFYYPLNGLSTDYASASGAGSGNQNGANVINLYTDINNGTVSTLSEERFPYRPDRGHVRITSPNSMSGVTNLSGNAFPVRWASFGLGTSTSTSDDLVLEFSRDGGTTWAYAIDNTGALLNNMDAESNTDLWEPYRSATVVGQYNDLQAVAPGDSNYSKDVMLRVSGTSDNNQDNITFTTAQFEVAPYFSFQNTGNNSMLAINNGTDMNFLGGASVLESWIKPYRFPTTEEAYFPIINKLDTTTGTIHYALRLLASGQLQLVVGGADGQQYTVESDSALPVAIPYTVHQDSVWSHVAVYVNLGNGVGTPDIRFYIDGNKQTSANYTGNLVTASNVVLNSGNRYPTYLAYEWRNSATYNQSFIGEMKGLRYWSGTPNGTASTGSEPTEMTKFIQGAANVKANQLLSTYKTNLVASFDFDGTAVVADNFAYYSMFSVVNGTNDSLNAKILVNNGVKFTGNKPFIKLAEPMAHAKVAQSNTALRVRWIGFNYDKAGFSTGNSVLSKNSDLEWSNLGGGGVVNIPYNPTSSDKDFATYTDAFSLPLTSSYKFLGTNPPHTQYAGNLNVSTTKHNSTSNVQEPFPAALENARLQLNGAVTINSASPYYWQNFEDLKDQTDVFSITPPSNFTVRVLLEGYQRSAVNDFGEDASANPQGILGTQFDENGLRITLYNDQSGTPGTIKVTTVNTADYVEKDPLAGSTRGNDGSQFGDVDYVFTDIVDSTYYVLVEHENHLPVMSRYSAPFTYSGDPKTTWAIESGWDFQNWEGDTTDILTAANAQDPTAFADSYSAIGAVSIDPTSPDYSRTALAYTAGQGSSATASKLSAMVAGDVIRDGQINVADAVQSRLEGLGNDLTADVTGDGTVNAVDRSVIDNNFGKVWSLAQYLDWTTIYNVSPVIKQIDNGTEFNKLNLNDVELSELINERAIQSSKNLDRMMQTSDNIKEIRKAKLQAGGLSYNVYSEPQLMLDEGLLMLNVYIENTGDPFALGNCTFALDYDNKNLSFVTIANTEKSPWNDDAALGYFKTYSAPLPVAPKPIDNVRSVEVDYDNKPYRDASTNTFYKHPGYSVPFEKTLVGTLVFAIKDVNLANKFDFKWHFSTAVLDIDGNNITGYGNFDKSGGVDTKINAVITSPNGGENWKTGKSYFVSWTKPSFEQNLFVELSLDRGNSWIRLNNNQIQAAATNFEYNVDNFESNECLVRIINATDNTVVDISDNVFSITQPKNRVIKPTSTDPIYFAGQKAELEYVAEEVELVKFLISANGSTNWKELITNVGPLASKVEWIVPSDINSDKVVIAMYDAKTNEYLASSEAFRVLSGNVAFISPRAGDVLDIKNDPIKTVRWNNNNVVQFDLQLSIDGGLNWTTIEENTNALKQNWDWKLPNINTDKAVIRAIFDNNNNLEYARSGMFTIANGATDVKVISANVTEPYPNPFSDKTTINFDLTEFANVSVEVYNTAGAMITNLVNNEPMNAGAHSVTWKAGELSAGVYYIKVTVDGNTITKEVILHK